MSSIGEVSRVLLVSCDKFGSCSCKAVAVHLVVWYLPVVGDVLVRVLLRLASGRDIVWSALVGSIDQATQPKSAKDYPRAAGQ